MRIHFLQHVHYEGPASIARWVLNCGHVSSMTRLYKGESLPTHKNYDFLVIMGGPMGIHDDAHYRMLNREKIFIRDAIEAGKVVMGICLGAQLIASVLGAKVTQNKHREIGWHKLTRKKEVDQTILANVFPYQIDAFHWHGDTFEIPKTAVPLASSEACENQGFLIENRIIGLQFHLEATPTSVKKLFENCQDDLDNSDYVQSEEAVYANQARFSKINAVLNAVLTALSAQQKNF